MKTTSMPNLPSDVAGKVTITRTGLQISSQLTFGEWEAMAARFGAAMSSAERNCELTPPFK